DIMKESSMYQYLFKDAIEEGIIKGKKEGKIEGEKDSIIYFLRARFKKIPARITKKIRAIKEESALEELIVAAATSNSIEEFEKHLST
ncbi:MAG: hypothetical protein ACE5KT_02885, partial [Methanosarcinales archaeon]